MIDSRENGDVKVVTGPRRCGKSWLLTRLYKEYLIADGVPEEDIVIVSYGKSSIPLEACPDYSAEKPRFRKQITCRTFGEKHTLRIL